MAPVGAGCRQTVWTQSFSDIDQPAQLVAVVERLVATCDVALWARWAISRLNLGQRKVSLKSSVGLLPGPEGGFSPGEIALLGGEG